MEQIIRIPYKYGELINTMEDCQCGELMKALFSKNPSKLKGLTLTYYNIIIVDINNIENQVITGRNSGKKGGRPKKNNPPLNNGITPPFGNSKPNIRTDNIKEDNIKEDNININSKELTTKVETYGNEDINNLIKEIKQTASNLGIAYNKDQERIFAKHILTAKEFGIFCENIGQDRITFAKNILIASEQIKFWKGICSGTKSIYQNYSEVFNATKTIKKKVVDYGTDFGDIY